MGATERDQLIKMWELERGANLKILTTGEITAAWEYKILDDPQALGALEALGYTAFDAWVILSIKNKAPIGAAPAGAPSPTDRIG
jgi:hypothetical protein